MTEKLKRPGVHAFSGTLGTSLFIQGCTALSGVLAARLLGPELRGQFAAVILWPSVIAAIGICGTNWAVARAAAHSDADMHDIGGSILLLSLFLAAVSIAVGWHLLPLLLAKRPGLIGIARLYLACWIPFNYIGLNLLAIDHGRGNFLRFNWTRALLSPVYIGAILVSWLMGYVSVAAFAFALLIGNAAVTVARLVCFLRDRSGVRISIKNTLGLLQSGVPFAVAGVGMLLAMELDRIIVVSFFGDAEVGFYFVALAFASIFSGIATSLGKVTFSRSAQTADPRELADFVSRGHRRSLLIGAAAACVVASMGPLLIVPAYGAAFQKAIVPCVLLAMKHLFLVPATFMDESLRGRGKPILGVLAKFADAAAVVLAAVILAPRWGIAGMALAVSLGCSIRSVFLSKAGQKLFQIPLRDLWLPNLADAKAVLAGAGATISRCLSRAAPARQP